MTTLDEFFGAASTDTEAASDDLADARYREARAAEFAAWHEAFPDEPPF